MRPIPFVPSILLTSAALSLAIPAAGATARAAAQAAPRDTVMAQAPARLVPPAPAMPAVLRASGSVKAPGAAETLDTSSSEEGEEMLPGLPATPAVPAAQAVPKAAPAVPAAVPAVPATPEPVPGTAGPSGVPAVPSPGSGAADTLVAPGPKTDTVMKVMEPALAEAPGLASLKVGGTFQLKAFYHDMAADADEDKRLSFDLRRARLDFAGGIGKNFAFEGQFQLEGDNRQLGTGSVYLAYRFNEFLGIKGGKLKRPFSQEALQSSKSLYTVERGQLYQTFLTDVTGYSSYDLGLVFHGGFLEEDMTVTYEAGIFNGKQSSGADEGYAGQHYQGTDAGFKAKDFAFRLAAQPFKPLKVEACLSTKAAEDRSDPENFDYHVNTAYELGMDLRLGRLRILGEAAWGDNHQGVDARIISGSSRFFAFYGTGVWHEDYSRGRASELVLKVEGLDPDFEPGSGEGTPNDGNFRYTLGCNWFFNPRTSVLVNYGILHPITEIPGEDELVHDFDALWRISF